MADQPPEKPEDETPSDEVTPPSTEAPMPAPPAAPPPAEGAAPAEAFSAAGGDGAGVKPAEERDLWTGRTSWKHYYGKGILWGVCALVVLIGSIWATSNVESWQGEDGRPGWFWWVLAVVILGSGSFLVIKFAWSIFSVRYRLTTQRLFVERGILSRTTDQTELIRVDDVSVKQGLVDRLVNAGDVQILSTDVSDQTITLVGVEAPDKIAEHIRQNMRQLRQKSLFVEHL
jgi:membrane protein YdbS with pleckstrin-like domain